MSDEEAARRLAVVGPNRLPQAKGRSALQRFLVQFNNPLIYVLLAAAVVTAALDHWLDTAVILAVVLVNAVIGFIQEGKAERALQAIRDMLSPKATVLRGGRRLSVPVEKDVAPVAGDAPLGDRTSMVHAGTLVTQGHGVGVVVAPGAATEIGRISHMLSEVEEVKTPLLRQFDVFAHWLTLAILGVAGLVFAYGVLGRGYEPIHMFIVVVSLSVAAIPEGLPAVLTVTLAIGVQRMAARHTIIRRLPAVETLGSVSVICSDKTGTLTRNEMTVQAIVTADGAIEVTGTGYAPVGGFYRDGVPVQPDAEPSIVTIARAGLLCNEASLRERDGEWVDDGDPVDGALRALAHKAGLDPATEPAALPRTDLIPFDSQHRYMASLHHDHEGNGHIFVKGAPERLLEMSDREWSAAGERPLDRADWAARGPRSRRRGSGCSPLLTRGPSGSTVR